MQSGQADVPPELQPYYQPTRREELRRAVLLVVPLAVMLVIIGGLIWGGWWLTHRSNNGKSSISTSQNGNAEVNGSSDTDHLPTYLRPSPKPTKPKPQSSHPDTLVNTGLETRTLLLPVMAAVVAAAALELRKSRTAQ